MYAQHFLGDEPFLLLFGDDLIMHDVPASKQLIDAFYRKQSPIICIERVSDSRVSSYGIIESSHSDGRTHRVEKFLEKPQPTETNSRL